MSLAEIDTLLFDLDGTIYLNDIPFDGVVTAVNRFLEREGRTGVALTNNSSKSSDLYIGKLSAMGFRMDRLSVVTPIEVGANYLRENGIDRAFILGTRACIAEFEKFGICFDRAAPECVIVCFDTECTYSKLSECAFHMARGIPTFQTNIDMYCPTLDGRAPDCGSLVALLVGTTGVAPIQHFGKPGELMAQFIRRRHLVGRKAIMFGDRLSTDIALGERLSAATVWVRTGDPTTSPGITAHYTANTMASFLDEYF